MPPVIHVEHLSKRYHLGATPHGGYFMLRDAIVDAATGACVHIGRWAMRAVRAPQKQWADRRSKRESRIGDLGHNGAVGHAHNLDAEANPALDPRRDFEDGGEIHPDADAKTNIRPAVHAPVGRHQEFWALRDVNFQIAAGEVVAIIGRNGAGKSTLLKALSRIIEPTSGKITLRGRIASLLEVGTGFHPELTGKENIYLNGAILGMSRREIQRKFDEIVAFAEIEQFLNTPVKRYSSGMYVRLAFAVAAHLDPEILLVDEVLAVGDASFQKKCLNKMEDVGHSGRTVLFVSHNMSAVTRLCPRAIWLADGHVHKDGPTREVAHAYLRSGTNTTAAREWPDPATAPKGPHVRLIAVRVTDDRGEVDEAFDIRKPIHIAIDYWCEPHDRFPFANVQLFNEEGVCILTSGDFVNPEWRRRPRDFCGAVTSVCMIPGNFLAEGQIHVLVALTTHNPTEVLIVERDVVSFLVIDSSQGDGARGEYVGHFPGVVRPLLGWNTSLPT